MLDQSPLMSLPEPCRGPMHYRDIVAQAAADLETALRANVGTGRRVYLRTWPAVVMRPGMVFVHVDGDEMRPDPYAGKRWPAPEAMSPIVRPRHAGSWEMVPYAHLATTVHEALRQEPILGPGDEV